MKALADGYGAEVRARARQIADHATRVNSAKRVVLLFEIFNWQDLGKTQFVIYNTGVHVMPPEGLRFTYALGWLLSTSEREVGILGEDAELKRWDRPRSLPRRWEQFKKDHPEQAPLPAQWIALSPERIWRSVVAASEDAELPFIDPRVVDPLALSLHAYWAFKLGNDGWLLRLTDRAQELLVKEAGLPDQARELFNHVQARVAGKFRQRTIVKAAKGAPRAELAAEWGKLVAQGSGSFDGTEAQAIMKEYEREIAEDLRWVEPTMNEFRMLSSEMKAEYWIFKLRDLKAWPSPGMTTCDVLQDETGQADRMVSPARELVKLGEAALSAVIKHLDDPRPTRAIWWNWNDKSLESYYVLRYADCCRQIFESITGVQLGLRGSGFIHRDGLSSEYRLKAHAWLMGRQK
jgi:hypothetical protein